MNVETVERLAGSARIEAPDGSWRPLTAQQTNMLREFITEEGVTTAGALGTAARSVGRAKPPSAEASLIKVQISRLRGAIKPFGFEIVYLGGESRQYQLRER